MAHSRYTIHSDLVDSLSRRSLLREEGRARRTVVCCSRGAGWRVAPIILRHGRLFRGVLYLVIQRHYFCRFSVVKESEAGGRVGTTNSYIGVFILLLLSVCTEKA